MQPDREFSNAARWHRRAVALLAAVALFEALWELWLAPLTPGGSWLALKALPLAWLWFRFARGSRRVRQVTSLLLPLYAGEGVLRAMSEQGRHALAAAMATVLALAALAAVLMTFRAEGKAASGETSGR